MERCGPDVEHPWSVEQFSINERCLAGGASDVGQLWTRFHAGDRDARGALIETYAGYAESIAHRMHVPTGALASRDDLGSAALVGLIQAIDRYESERGVPFEGFAALRIRGAILDELRLVDDRSRATRQQERGSEEGAARLTFSIEEILAAGGAETWLTDDGIDARHDDEDLRMRVELALRGLPPRQRELLGHYYGEALTLREAGASMGISEARACQLHGRAIENLRRDLIPARQVAAA